MVQSTVEMLRASCVISAARVNALFCTGACGVAALNLVCRASYSHASGWNCMDCSWNVRMYGECRWTRLVEDNFIGEDASIFEDVGETSFG